MTVFDCSMFHWEFDLLELRMKELWDAVDYFVVTESLYDHRGNPREIVLEKNQSRFDWAKEKMIINVSDRPEVASGSWDYERHHRVESIRAAIRMNPKDDDLFLVSDMDEIFRASTVQEVSETTGIFTAHMPMFYYYFNLFVEPWFHPTMISFKHIEQFQDNLSSVRNCNAQYLFNAGWHFSYLGSEEQIQNKLKTFAHDEYDSPQYTDIGNIKNAMHSKTDLFGRPMSFVALPIDETWPKEIYENQDKYQNHILPIGEKKMNKLITDEDPFVHWADIDVQDKTILDLGAGDFGRIGSQDYLSTPEYWLSIGAAKVVAVDNVEQDLEKYQDARIENVLITLEKPNDIESLISQFNPDLIKCDIEGWESLLFDMDPKYVQLVQGYAVETHNLELYDGLMDFFSKNSYEIVWSAEHAQNSYVRVVYAQKRP